jgi:hypothetical protein
MKQFTAASPAIKYTRREATSDILFEGALRRRAFMPYDLSVPAENSIEVPGSNDNYIDYSGDVDTYRVYLPGLHSYEFDVFGGTDADGGTFDPTLALYDGNGTQVAFDDDSGSGLDAHVDYWADSGGWYTLAVAGYGDDTGDYNLTTSADWLA